MDYISDYHIHTPYCGHAHGTIIKYVETAISKGMKEIYFTDHLGRYYLSELQKKRYWDWGMDSNKLDRYVLEINDVKNIYRNAIDIRIGLEIDYIEGAEDKIDPIIEKYPFDFIDSLVLTSRSLGDSGSKERFGLKVKLRNNGFLKQPPMIIRP
jgi:histidinol-phosphatase (PHP family)